MAVYVCGLNVNGQVIKDGPGVICCPTHITWHTDITQAIITFNHIFWHTRSGWICTGFKQDNIPDQTSIEQNAKVFASDNRTVILDSGGSILLWEKGWRKLLFQDGLEELEFDDQSTATQHNEETDEQDSKKTKKRQNISDVEEDTDEKDSKKTKKTINISKGKDTDEKDSKTLNTSNVGENTDEDDSKTLNTSNVGENTDEDNSKKMKKTQSISNVEEIEDIQDSEKPKKFLKTLNNSESVEEEDGEDINRHGIQHSRSFSQVAVEDNSLLALSTDGVVYNGGVPLPVRVKMKEVAVGKEHCITLSQHGTVYTWGSGMRGQLGVGELCKSEKPLIVESLEGINISSIACGAWHCIARSECGDVYVWGWNESGQLGFPQRSHNNTTIFESFHHTCQCPENQRSINTPKKPEACGNKEDEHVLDNLTRQDNYGDSRINSDRSTEEVNVQASPILLDFWAEDVNVVSVECGNRHTVFLLDDGSAWAAGMNRYGQLGMCHTTPVKEPNEVLKGVARVFAGGWNSVYLTSTPHS